MTESRLARRDALSVLRAAARELLPVVVYMGPDQARYGSFVGSVTEGGSSSLVLEPVAADALPTHNHRPFRIVPADGRADWVLSASHITRESPTRVRVDLAQARLLPSDAIADGSVPVQATDLLVLVVPGGLHGGSAYVFPIQRIGTDMCEIRSSVALEPGQVIEQVEIVGDRRLLRRASAQVIETVPWYMANGMRMFTCRISLGEPGGATIGSAHDLVTDPKEVRRLLEVAAMLRAQGWYEAPGWSRGSLRFLEVGRDYAVLDLSADPPSRRRDPHNVRIGVELFAVSYELDVRALGYEAGQLRTSLPLILRRRRRHRRDHRVPVVAPHHVQFSFRHPVTGMVQKHAVSEVSFFALRFDCPPHGSVLWAGLPLEQAQLTWGDRLIHLGDLLVEQYGYDQRSERARCVASIPQSSVADDPDMITLLATLAHPRVRVHDGRNFSALHATYLKAGLFGPHMHRNLVPILDQTATVWRKLHAEASDVVRTFVHGPDQAPDAAVTIMRAWEHGWVLQHFVDTSPELNGATGRLQAAYLDHLVPRPDGRYLVFFVKTDNKIMNAYLTRFFASTGTPEAVARSTVELWIRPADGARGRPPPDDTRMRPCTPNDELVIARSAETCLDAYAAAALSLVPGELDIPDTQQRFAHAGLSRDRDCQMVMRGDEAVYAVIEERATPGINLSWMLNASWILPIHPDLDSDGAALDRTLQALVDRPSQAPTGERFLNLPEGLNADQLNQWGYTKEATLYLYTITRAGLHRLFTYTTTRHGEVGARSAARERRRASLRPEPEEW